MIPEGEQKRGFLRMLREKLPELPAWLKYENQVQAARERLEVVVMLIGAGVGAFIGAFIGAARRR